MPRHALHKMVYVLYHSPCNDGFGAALCAWLWFGDKAEYYPQSYLTKMPKMKSKSEVYCLDFAPSRETLIELQSKMKKVVVLDHHKTNYERVGDLDCCWYDMNKSGAMMAWLYFLHKAVAFDNKPSARAEFIYPRFDFIKELIDNIQDRDLFLNVIPESREVFFSLSSLPLDFKTWKDVDLDDLRKEGAILAKQADKLVASNLKHSFLTDKFKRFGYGYVPTVNSTMTVYNTDICMALLDKYPDSPISCNFFHLADGRIKWSMRSRSEKDDVAKIAEAFGGLGHKQASSFIE